MAKKAFWLFAGESFLQASLGQDGSNTASPQAVHGGKQAFSPSAAADRRLTSRFPDLPSAGERLKEPRSSSRHLFFLCAW